MEETKNLEKEIDKSNSMFKSLNLYNKTYHFLLKFNV